MSVVSTLELELMHQHETTTSAVKIKITPETHPKWTGRPPATLFSFKNEESNGQSQQKLPMRLHAIADACPHVAIGSLAKGDACVLPDLEDLAVVTCPVHSFAFDLTTGHCVTDKRRKTPAANVYSTRIWQDNNGKEVVQISTKVKPVVENTVSLEVGPGVTHVVAGRPGTEKCVQGLAMGCHIVRKEWLDDSMARWIRRPEAAYTFPDLKRYESTPHPPGSAPFKPGLLLQYHVPKAPPPAFSEEEEDDDEEGVTLGGSVEEEEEGESQKRRRIHSVEEECGEGSNIDGDDSSEEEYDDEEVDVTDFY